MLKPQMPTVTHNQSKQGVALMRHNRIYFGPPWNVGHPTAHAPGQPAGSVTDDNRRQRAKQYWAHEAGQ